MWTRACASSLPANTMPLCWQKPASSDSAWLAQITEVISPEIVVPAVGQGALGVEFFAPREDEFSFLDKLVDKDTMLRT